MTNHG